MRYRLLSTMQGIAVDTEEVVEEKFTFVFENAPEGSVTVISTVEGEIYKEIKDYKCGIYRNQIITGDIGVIVVNYEKNLRYECDRLEAVEKNGKIYIRVNNWGIRNDMTKLKIKNAEYEDRIKELEARLKALEETTEKWAEGWNSD